MGRAAQGARCCVVLLASSVTRPRCLRPVPRQGNYKGAVNAYSRALALDPPEDIATAVLSNRAACRLKLGDPAAAAVDCSAALEMVRARLARAEASGALAASGDESAQALLRLPNGAAGDGGAAAATGAPAEEGASLTRLLVKLLGRRAAAAAALGDVRAAEADLTEALRCGRCAWLLSAAQCVSATCACA